MVSEGGSNRRGPSSIHGMAEHQFENSSQIVEFLLKTNDGRGGRSGWAILNATYTSAKTQECKSYNTSYEDLLLKSGFSSMNVKCLRTLCIQIFKTITNLNPTFMKEIFNLRKTNRPVCEKIKLNLDIPNYNQVTFGRKALTFFGPKTWNSLPYHIKSTENLALFKAIIKF